MKVFETIQNQIKALEKLQNTNEILFNSIKLCDIRQYIRIITAAYIQEYKASAASNLYISI